MLPIARQASQAWFQCPYSKQASGGFKKKGSGVI